jgi:NAD(P)-dependent dehydrogenase (short-subunit alcohol dehydrogenase family)
VTRRVLVVGGTGGFGRRLVEGLVATTDLDIVIGARNLDRSRALAARFPPGRASAIELDTRTVTATALSAAGAFAVVDTSGPFQGWDYRVARAAIAAGMHYVDLADARDFVAGFPALDTEAQAAGVVALTGASSTPALSHAALDQLTAAWRRIDRIEIAISPGNKAAPRGLAVIRSILSYAGQPVRVFDSGTWVARPGWGMLTRRDMRALGRRWLSLCETPDLDLVPLRFAPRDAAIFRAGLELSLIHLGLWLLSLGVRARLVPTLLPLASLLRWGADLLRSFGTDRGGMFVEAVGIDADGEHIRAAWSLVAAAGDGPVIPTLPVLAVIRILAAGGKIEPGARACVGILDLAKIEREFAPYHIDTEISRARSDR